jgi:hypothetical protein
MLRYSYYTAGSGGAGPTILETSFLLAGEECTVYKDGQPYKLPPISNRRDVDFGPGANFTTTSSLSFEASVVGFVLFLSENTAPFQLNWGLPGCMLRLRLTWGLHVWHGMAAGQTAAGCLCCRIVQGGVQPDTAAVCAICSLALYECDGVTLSGLCCIGAAMLRCLASHSVMLHAAAGIGRKGVYLYNLPEVMSAFK